MATHGRRTRLRPGAVIATLATAAAGFATFVLGFASGPAAAQVHAANVIVITVTAGKPSELGFTLSKTSVLPWQSATPSGAVTFKVTNKGALAHNFKICTSPVTTAKLNTCNGTSTKLLKKGQSTSLTITFKKRGKYEFLCTVPGHAAAGMKGLIGIGVKLTATPTTTTTVPTGKTTTTATSSGPPPATETLGGDPVAGAAVWASAGCASCHTLKAAGATGQVGPNLDSSSPGQDIVIQRVTNGINVMPAFNTSLSAGDIKNLAAYVYKSTHA